LATGEPIAIAVDLGGTQFRVAAVTRQPLILHRVADPTRADAEPDVVMADIARVVSDVCARASRSPVIGLGVTAPGPLDHVSGVVFQAPNLPTWRDVPLADELRRRTGLPVLLGNDANLAALAEARCGAGRGAQHLVYLTLSTGIGSGVVVDGRLLLGSDGAAAEAGHMALSMDGPLCGCGNRGCLEAYASGTGLVNRAREAIANGRPSQLSSYGSALDARHVEAAAERGDALASELIEEAGTALGLGVRNLLHLFNPEVVVIGGGVSRIGAPLWDPMMRVVEADALSVYRQNLRIVPAALGDDSGLLGAALLVHEAGPALAGQLQAAGR
jgi:glucokinase